MKPREPGMSGQRQITSPATWFSIGQPLTPTVSEKLAPEGRAGAEQVTEVMNATFDKLLEVAYDYGGGLLKFGGDALLLFFDGERHAERAVRASHDMRRLFYVEERQLQF